MLRDKYEFDPAFWAIIEQQALKMDPELAVIDRILEDEQLYHLIKADLAKHRPKTLLTGRNSTPVEVIIRMLAVKRLYRWSYALTEQHVRDSLILRWFCRIYFEPVFDHTNLNRWALLIQPETLHAFNDRLTTIATELKVTRGRKLRTDGTVVETAIHYPTDSSLLADGVRVLSRTLKRAKGLVSQVADVPTAVLRDRTRSARQHARRIVNGTRQKSAMAKTAMKRAYQQLIGVAQASVQQAQTVLPMLQAQTELPAQKLATTLTTFIPRLEQALNQTVRRVIDGEMVPAAQKIVSLFEAHTAIIRRQKAGKETEFGHKVWLDEVEGGIISRWEVLDGNPDDAKQWRPALDHHRQQFGQPPRQASGDRALYSPDNEAYALRQGVKRPILPQPGHKSEARRQYEAQPWFKRGRRFHAGVEGRISVVKRKHELGLCRDHGEDNFDKWVGWGIIAANLAVMGTALAR
ncbi:MAG: ISNCY family transposase [Anaerolineae bacterium]|nr:ISNCY family transposase [Anaerolineae bacterium]